MGCVPGKLVDASLLDAWSAFTPADEHLPFGESFHQDYAISQKLGKGAFGSVFLACRREANDCERVAVKVIDLRPKKKSLVRNSIDPKKQRSIDKEITILKALPKSDNLVSLVGEYTEGHLAYIVLELCEMGLLDAFWQMRHISENSVRIVLRDCMKGLAACHSACVVHRDVKADNCLAVSDGSRLGFKFKLCDFGLAQRVSSQDAAELSGVYGTPPFMAPEMLLAEKYGPKVDTWALGVFAYGLLFGSWPYMPARQAGPAMKAAIIAGVPPTYANRVNLPKVSGSAISWVQMLLERDPAKRLSAQMALSHRSVTKPWDDSEEVSFEPAIRAAKRVGAFDTGPSKTKSTPLDMQIRSMNSRRSMSGLWSAIRSSDVGGDAADLSTESGSESPCSAAAGPRRGAGQEAAPPAPGLRRGAGAAEAERRLADGSKHESADSDASPEAERGPEAAAESAREGDANASRAAPTVAASGRPAFVRRVTPESG